VANRFAFLDIIDEHGTPTPLSPRALRPLSREPPPGATVQPGRAKLATKPLPTGSELVAKMMGMLPAMPRIASAQTYPTRPIRLVVPFPPGGVFDAVARPWVDQIKPLLGTMIVENVGGSGSSLGAAAVARDRQCETFVSKASG
jgi:hypothetical protein